MRPADDCKNALFLCTAVAVGILYALEPVTAWMEASEMNGFVQLLAQREA